MNIIEIALKEYGNKGIPGTATNPDVLKYFSEIGFNYIHDDETPWCAAFMNWVLKQAGIPGTNKLNARSFLEFGLPTAIPSYGNIIVLWRGSIEGALGHVGIFIKQVGNQIYILGGNENNQVEIEAFPSSQVLGYREVPFNV